MFWLDEKKHNRSTFRGLGFSQAEKKICGGNNSDSLRSLQHLCVGTIFLGGLVSSPVPGCFNWDTHGEFSPKVFGLQCCITGQPKALDSGFLRRKKSPSDLEMEGSKKFDRAMVDPWFCLNDSNWNGDKKKRSSYQRVDFFL